MKNNRYIVIVGCGRLGSHLANQLSREGNSIVVIDRDDAAFDHLSSDFSGFRQGGDATQIAVLKSAKLDKADVLIATTHEDNVNLMTAQIARKIFRVPRVLARIFDPKREQAYRSLEIETVCPTLMAAQSLLRAATEDRAAAESES
jgi:trk system potassium uptake protein TrkA